MPVVPGLQSLWIIRPKKDATNTDDRHQNLPFIYEYAA
jgi:hypothetical protein